MSSHSELWTIGVEEEYQIIDPTTRALSGGAERILSTVSTSDSPHQTHIQQEIKQSQIEISTPICHSLSDVRTALQRGRSTLIDAANSVGLQIAASGTHPFSPWNEQELTPTDRYQFMMDTYQQLVREQVIFGYHIHIGCPDRECAVQVLNRARLWLAPLLALAANSPFWQGEETGYASFRTPLWWRWPTAGPPEHFTSASDYNQQIQTLVNTGAMRDASFLYWDIRLSKRYPTIEFRVTDVCLTIDDAVMIAGLARALAQTCDLQARQQLPVAAHPGSLLRAVQWQAARHGLNSTLADLTAGHSLPATDLIERLLDELRPTLEMLGDWEEISRLVYQTLQRGNGATRQQAIYQQTGDFQQVVDFIVQETAAGT